MDKNVWLLPAPQGVLERPQRVPATEDQYRDHCSGHISTLAVTLHKYKDKYKFIYIYKQCSRLYCREHIVYAIVYNLVFTQGKAM